MSVQLQAPPTMKAIVQHKYGKPEELELKEVATPAVEDDGVLVRVRAASVNALDWHFVKGPLFARPFIGWRRPSRLIPGVDVAGVVEAVGAKVTEFKPGDQVLGHRSGAFAEYVAGKERHFVLKPASLTFEQAAAVPVAGLTALQAIRDWGRVQAGQMVLINGSSGGVGTFTVQVAKAFGADVTAVCSTRSVDLVRSIGADHVIDRTREDFARSGQRYDVIIVVAADRSLADYRRVLAPNGTVVLAGAPDGLLPLLIGLLQSRMTSQKGTQRVVSFMAKGTKDDLLALKDLIDAGKLTPVVDRTYPLSQTAQAIRYLGERRAQGKVIITM